MKKNAVKSANGKHDERRFLTWPWIIAILLLTCFVYSGIFNFQLLNFDDIEYFTLYPEIINLNAESIGKYFSKHYVLMYQPLPVLTFALNYAHTGTDTSMMHFINFLFHLCNAVLVYIFAFRITSSRTGSLLVAVFFAIHPMNVEAVAWISARSSSMYTFFFLASLIVYINYIKKDFQPKHLFLCFSFFLLSLLCKAQAVTLPVVLLLLDYFFKRTFDRKALLEKIPFFLLSILFGIIALSDPSTQKNITSGMMVEYKAADIPFLVFYSFAFYVIKCFIPFSLCSVYVYPPKTNDLLPAEYYLSVAVIAVIVYLLLRFRKNRAVIFCAAFFIVTISINIQLIPSRLFIVTDRYGYVPFLGLFLIPVFLSKGITTSFNKKTLIACLIVLLLYDAVTARIRTAVWENDLTLMNDIIAKNPPVGYIHRAYGIRGLYHANNNNPLLALTDFTSAMALDSSDSKSFLNRGLVNARLENNKEAVLDFTLAIEKGAQRAEVYSYRSIVNYKLGDKNAALNDCNSCIRLDSTYFDCYITRATLSFEEGNYEASIADLSKAIYYKPGNNIAYKNRGQVYYQSGMKKEACSDWQFAAQLGNNEALNLYSTYCK